MRWIIFSILVLVVSACSKEQGIDLTVKKSLNVNINALAIGGGSTTKAGTFERGDAPSYISGVKISADFLDNVNPSLDIIDEEYLFVDNKADGGDKIILNDVAVGRNSITVKGICASAPVDPNTNVRRNGEIPSVDTWGTSNFDGIAATYSKNLLDIFPLYADYESKEAVEVNISKTGPNDVEIDMVAKNHRLAIVFESIAWDHDVSFTVERGGVELKSTITLYPNDRYAVVFNDDDEEGTKEYTINMNFIGKWWGVEDRDIKRIFTVDPGQNVTKYYKLTGDFEIYEGTSDANITWEPLEESSIGEAIN